ncbi:hypothetical protein MUP05_03670 [Candidatus Bathyarchaeota archaeon]|nr:hypothetical protein [Candidatus Bathyarchaeota archaeon]
MRRRTRQIRGERRSDEDSLYYILERDLDREALLPGHNGWASQVKVGKAGRIDYVVRYGASLIGIEVKKGFPDWRHFKQISNYRQALNAVFLAYPSDTAGEAVFLGMRNRDRRFHEIGVISIALYRSHVICPAERSNRRSEIVWIENFDEKEYWLGVRKRRLRGLDMEGRLVATSLTTGRLWLSMDKHGELGHTKRCELDESVWRTLSILYAFYKSMGIHKYHREDALESRFDKIYGRYKKWDWETPLKIGCIYRQNYSSRLSVYTFSREIDVLMPLFEKKLREEIGWSNWSKINSLVTKLRRENRKSQKDQTHHFLRVPYK